LIRSKVDEYKDLLFDMYDEKFLFNGIEGNYEGILIPNDYILELNEPYKINEAMIKYRRTPGKGCENCIKIFLKVMKLQRLIINYLKENPKAKKREVYNQIKNEFHNLEYKDSDFGMVNGVIKGVFKKKNPHPPNYNITFYNRPMEFPGFYKSIDLSKNHVKDIMIIGEAAGPNIATNINCTYGLSNTEIDDTGKILTENIFNELKKNSTNLGESFNLLKGDNTKLKGLHLDEQIEKFRKNLDNSLWERLYRILPISLKVLKSRVYVTDLVKCNAKGNSIWKHFREKCFKSFLIHEIRIINPKLIIFLGNTGYNYLKKMFEFDEFCPTTNDGTPFSNESVLKEHPEYSKYLIYNFRSDKYLKRYYEDIATSNNKEKNFSNKLFTEFTQKDKETLIKKLTIPSSFPTFGTIFFEYNSTRTPIKFIKIFHNSDQNTSRWKVYTYDYKEFLTKLVDDKIIIL